MARTTLVFPVALAGLIVAFGNLAVAANHSGAKERTARVAGGQTVVVAKSRFSSDELAKQRPRMDALIPTKR